jgi:hypothetical protein
MKPRRSTFVKKAMAEGMVVFEDSRKYDVRGKCALCGGFGSVIEKSREDFPTRELICQEMFLFCKYNRCSEVFGKYVLHDPLKPCLITPSVFKKQKIV